MGEVLQHSADAHHRKSAAELRYHDGPAETAAVQEDGTGGTVDHLVSSEDSFLFWLEVLVLNWFFRDIGR